MEHGFTRAHFDLLGRWGGHHYDSTDAAKAAARDALKDANAATRRWADALQLRRFPSGWVDARNAPINQGHAFSPYTWAKVYPTRWSPTELAYTVGIDAEGFTVKIDTVGKTPARAAYAALTGGSNYGSPIAEILPPEDGLQLSFEQLVDWSAEAIRRFRYGYDEVLRAIGLQAPGTMLVDDEAASRAGFALWRRALLDGAVSKGSLFWLLEGGIVFRLGRSGRTADHDRMELGVDPTGSTWAVQINEPRVAGEHNPLSAIGTDAAGERILLRQGFLLPNEPGGRTISGAEFVSRTGLTPEPVEAEGRAARRLWFRVCSLDSTPEESRLATSRFVDRCAAARDSADAGEAPEEVGPEDLFAGEESGGTYTVRRRAAEERTVVRRQGAVWLALKEILTQAGLRVRKGRDRRGYQVDAEIDGGEAPPLLVEIKSGLSAADIHAGVGQLHLYPQLIKRLSAYERALLLPGLPAPEVRRAVEACGIAIHTFNFVERAGEAPQVTFSSDLLDRYGTSVAE